MNALAYHAPPVLDRLLQRSSLLEAEAFELWSALASGTIAPALAGAVLAALRAKGETADELRGFARAMRRLARRPAFSGRGLLDVVGTGGDGSGSLNLSTGAALLAAAAGARVAKHGNRAVSGRCGSADVLEALGLVLPLSEERSAAALRAHRFTFLFAPHYHPAMAVLAPVRRALGVRTVANLLGPLVNPAQPDFLLVGAADLDTAALLAETLAGLPLRHAWVVHGAPAWDEPTPVGPFAIFAVRDGLVRCTTGDPDAYGVRACGAADLLGGEAEGNARALREALSGAAGPPLEALVLGAAVALQIAGLARTPREGAARARAAVKDGRALHLLDALRGIHA